MATHLFRSFVNIRAPVQGPLTGVPLNLNTGSSHVKWLRVAVPSRAKCRGFATRRVVLANGHHENDYDFDMFTIGAGSGGVRASRQVADRGAKVAVCELPYGYKSSDTIGGIGGTCVLRGCVPKKLMVYASEFAEEFRDGAGFGWEMHGWPSHNWGMLLQNKRQELDRLNSVYKKLLHGSGVEVIEGRGTIVDPHTVEVNGKRYTAKHILISTGGHAVKLKIPGAEHAITSDDALELDELPKRIVIVGGGYIAVEFAGIFNSFGADTHLVYRADRPLRGFDEEVRTFITEQFAVQGLHLHPKSSPVSIIQDSNGTFTVDMKLTDGSTSVIEGADKVFMATGRAPNTKNLILEEVGVELSSKGAVMVNEYSQSSVPSIWAIGDVTDRIALTPVALMEGMALAKTLFGNTPTKADHVNVASAVFSQPPMASVGMTEEAAAQKLGDVDIYVSSFRPLKNTISNNPGKAFMKLVVDAESNRVVGVHMVGPESAEIMQGMAVAVKMGVTKPELDSVVGIHPTSAEEFVTMRNVSRKIRS